MRQKYEARDIIPKFFNMVGTQFNSKVKMFRFDNAPELRFQDYFDSKGVIH